MCMERELKYMAPLDILVVVGLRVHVWYICGCWPSCHVWYICGCWPSCHVFCRFWEPPRAGEVLPKFWVDTNHFCPFLQEEDLWEGLGDPDRLRRRCGSSCTASTRHCTDSPPPRYPDLTATLGITPLSVCGLWSRNLVRYTDLWRYFVIGGWWMCAGQQLSCSFSIRNALIDTTLKYWNTRHLFSEQAK